jgi:hypothetical protein
VLSTAVRMRMSQSPVGLGVAAWQGAATHRPAITHARRVHPDRIPRARTNRRLGARSSAAEHPAHNRRRAGSNPAGPTTFGCGRREAGSWIAPPPRHRESSTRTSSLYPKRSRSVPTGHELIHRGGAEDAGGWKREAGSGRRDGPHPALSTLHGESSTASLRPPTRDEGRWHSLWLAN